MSFPVDIENLFPNIDAESDNIDDLALIKVVKCNPHLYDKSLKTYKGAALKKDTWQVIAGTCGASSGVKKLYSFKKGP